MSGVGKSFTLETICKPASLSGNQIIVAKGDTQIAIKTNASGKLEIRPFVVYRDVVAEDDVSGLKEALKEALKAAEEAMAIAEEAKKAAEDAYAKAEEAQTAAEEAAQTSAENAEAARKAKEAAEAAQAEAEATAKAAQTAAEAAEAAQTAAEEANVAAAQETLKAAQEAADAAQSARTAATEAARAAEAQRAAEEAQEEAERALEEARLAAELESAKQDALMEIMLLNMGTDTDSMKDAQLAAYKEALMDAIAAITAAEDKQTVDDTLAQLKAELDIILDKNCPSKAYVDVDEDAWYHEYVDYMLRNGYMNGVSDTVFDVSGTTTRGQLVTILYRIAGEPSVEGMDNPFADVEDGLWYTNAIIWAADAGVVNGVSATEFMPNEKVTRQQIVTILYRYAKAEPVSEDHLAGFADADEVADFAKDAMNWAVGEGIVNGVTDTLLAPNDTAIRVQICAILMRFLEK